jgi:hypothetical protein
LTSSLPGREQYPLACKGRPMTLGLESHFLVGPVPINVAYRFFQFQ